MNLYSSEAETLIMPGEVIEGHKKYEIECSNCHRPFSNVKQTTLCRDCHKNIDTDIQGQKGFHGKHPDIRNMECKSCHTDHKGRKASIVNIDVINFDHELTDFSLSGSHKGTRCIQCHTGTKKYREAGNQCIDCHKHDDIHKNNLGTECSNCHKTQSWKESGFDHSKTEFRLIGKHKNTNCINCHIGEQYKDLPTNCYSCHLLDDRHGGNNGKKCQTCHSESAWNEIRFDHTRNTEFKLDGRHKSLQCVHCHKNNNINKKMNTSCNACHNDDDVHHGTNGKECGQCHNNDSWTKATFNHNKKTDFPLKGNHQHLACLACHKPGSESNKAKSGCNDCHESDDVHKTELGARCENCHTEGGWNQSVRFDHDMSHFPLNGLHASVPCEECHTSLKYRKTPSTCNDCHSADDKHDGALGNDCAYCHNPNAWQLWNFDHSQQTEFSLTGAHTDLVCNACHTQASGEKPETASTCQSCHQQDDVHFGSFGRNCERCHTTDGFQQLKIDL